MSVRFNPEAKLPALFEEAAVVMELTPQSSPSDIREALRVLSEEAAYLWTMEIVQVPEFPLGVFWIREKDRPFNEYLVVGINHKERSITYSLSGGNMVTSFKEALKEYEWSSDRAGWPEFNGNVRARNI